MMVCLIHRLGHHDLEQLSGPGTVTFADATAVDTTASFTVDGTYVLRLTADDSALTAFDELTVTVNPVAGNQVPTVDAGPDQSITLPTLPLSTARSAMMVCQSPATVTTAWSRDRRAGHCHLCRCHCGGYHCQLPGRWHLCAAPDRR